MMLNLMREFAVVVLVSGICFVGKRNYQQFIDQVSSCHVRICAMCVSCNTMREFTYSHTAMLYVYVLLDVYIGMC